MRRISGTLGCLVKPCNLPLLSPQRSLRCCIASLSLELGSARHVATAFLHHHTFSSAASHPTPTQSPPRRATPLQRTAPQAYVSFLSTSQSDTHSLASVLAAYSGPGDVLLLFGSVGEGKTELARGFLRGYTGMSELIVTSPTYTVMLEYAHRGHRVHHVDLYRLDKPGDLSLLPLQQMFKQDVSLVEWPERLAEWPPQALRVRLEKLVGDSYDKRHCRVITLSAQAEPWRSRIQQWKEKGLEGHTTYTS